jgi:hypothetical protein
MVRKCFFILFSVTVRLNNNVGIQDLKDILA